MHGILCPFHTVEIFPRYIKTLQWQIMILWAFFAVYEHSVPAPHVYRHTVSAPDVCRHAVSQMSTNTQYPPHMSTNTQYPSHMSANSHHTCLHINSVTKPVASMQQYKVRQYTWNICKNKGIRKTWETCFLKSVNKHCSPNATYASHWCLQ